jgi:hypothetical protein
MTRQGPGWKIPAGALRVYILRVASFEDEAKGGAPSLREACCSLLC